MVGEAREFKHRKGNFSPFCHIFFCSQNLEVDRTLCRFSLETIVELQLFGVDWFVALFSLNMNINFPH